MARLCYICEATQGGVRKHLCELLRVFSRKEEGFEVHALLGDRGEPGLREELADIAQTTGNLQYTFVPNMQRPIHPLRDMRAYVELKEQLRAIKPDLIHTHSSKGGYIGRLAAHALGMRNAVHTSHVFAFQWTAGPLGSVYLALEKQAARYCRTLVCVGEGQRDNALKRGVAPAEKFTVIRNGIELPPLVSPEVRAELRRRIQLPAETPVVGMVARLAPQKGVGMFVRAAARVLEQRPDVTFVLVGGGPLTSEILERSRELKLPTEQFKLLGHRQDAAQLYPAFDVLALSSLYEGLPYVLLEAMAYGVPVVATDVLGSHDVVIDGETGFLARPSDPAQIAEKLLLVLNDRVLHARQSAAARQHVAREYSFRQFIDGHRDLYRDLYKEALAER